MRMRENEKLLGEFGAMPVPGVSGYEKNHEYHMKGVWGMDMQ